jgi:hypothetical protein
MTWKRINFADNIFFIIQNVIGYSNEMGGYTKRKWLRMRLGTRQ